jgi:PadR family transcriptional regulator, regulatory protein PadR
LCYSNTREVGFDPLPRSKKTVNDEQDSVRLSAIEEDLLTVLLGRELYGLEILGELNADRPIPLRFSSLYPVLNRLEQKGLVDWKWGNEMDESGGARRKYYKVTDLGAKTLQSVQEYRTALMLRAMLPEETIAELIALKRHRQKQNIPKWKLNLELTTEFLLLLWAIHIQIRLQNLSLPPSKKRNIE